MKSNFFYEFIRYVSIFLIIISLFVFILTLSSMFPSKEIYNNVKYSSDILIKEGNRKKVYIPYKAKEMEFDNYTDALMINNAYSIDYQTPLLSSMIVRKNYIPDVTNVVYKDTIGELKSSSKYDKYNPVGELKDFVNGEKAESFEYARYWHGYLSVLRPLLTIFNITQLRYILSIVLILLVIILIHSLYKKTNIIVSIIYFFSLFSVEYFYLGFSLQGIFVFLISLIGTIVLIKVFDKIGNYGCIFFVVGMLANFFDFLTVPIVTLALPLITYFLLKQRKDENYTFKMQVVDFISLCLLWLFGYAGTWMAKWILVDLLYDKEIIAIAIEQVLYRSVGKEQFNVIDVILENLKYMDIMLVASLLGIGMIIFFEISQKEKIRKKIIKKDVLVRMFPYIIIASMPFIWYSVLKNHSYYHAFFTYRNLLLTVLGLNLCMEESVRMHLESNK